MIEARALHKFESKPNRKPLVVADRGLGRVPVFEDDTRKSGCGLLAVIPVTGRRSAWKVRLWRVNLGERRATIWMRTVSRLDDDARHLIVAGRTTQAVDCR